jgi:hypothetical protein
MPWGAEPRLSRLLRRVVAEVLLAVVRLGLTVPIGVAGRLGRHSSRGGAGGRGCALAAAGSYQTWAGFLGFILAAHLNKTLASIADFADPKSYANV